MAAWGEKMRAKLGFLTPQQEDNDLLTGLLALMSQESSDYTRTFRMLSEVQQQEGRSPLRDEFIDREAFDAWYQRYQQRLLKDESSDETRQQRMKAVNPAVILRNYLAQQAIEGAEQGDITMLKHLHQALSDPFSGAPEFADLAGRPPEWSKKIEVSCSS